jgi:hypothetical protein
MKVNQERGEIPLNVNGEKGVICAEMQNFAAFSSAIGTKSFPEMMERLQGFEPAAMYAAIDCFLTQGDAKAIKAAMRKPADLVAVSTAVIQSVSVLWEDAPKNV